MSRASMTVKRSVAVAGPLSPAKVWERYADPDRWPSWSPPIRRVERTGFRLTSGMTGIVHLVGGVRVPFTVHLVDDEARTWSWKVDLGPVSMTLLHEVLARSDGGSVATLTVEGPLPLALVYPDLARPALHRLVH